ncbi:MAG: thioredoxin domain-containing protein, partial [Phaeodactylibacter sp.]|nr:thioredoxin domain-containing protein [Phaeodactylibacter sp.]
MNRLQYETSPYLLQHANNPVDWYAWRPEAFERAKREDKPILVSIGYSTCHWCHVMEHESFEDRDVADFMNTHFINIKVDREERPDVDQIYMEACQAIQGSGGWPLNCFLTPDGKPFYAGTYYPPMPAYNRPSWFQLMGHMIRQFNEDRQKVEEQADYLLKMIQRSDNNLMKDRLQVEKPAGHLRVTVDSIYQSLKKQFDEEEGGFGGAPKFPGTMNLRFLLNYHHFTGDEQALAHVRFSLRKMIEGGIYDQLGGGFARYAVDKAWLVPHFEKMLYDNALLVQLMAETYQLTQDPLLLQTIRETLTFIEREMMSPEGGFYAALDADSEGEEGKFYVWDKAEIDAALGVEAAVFNDFYGVSTAGNWEGVNILNRPRPLDAVAEAHGMSTADLEDQLNKGRATLLALRAKRIRPGLDDKILLNWNALMCRAYVAAYNATGEEAYRETALRNLHFLLDNFVKDPQTGALYHTYKSGKATYDAFLDDYAYLIDALLGVYQMTFEPRYLKEAARLAELVLKEFLDESTKMFYFTSSRQSDIPIRRKDLYDSATPSGNSTMVHNLLQLNIALGTSNYQTLAEEQVFGMLEAVER